MGARKKLKAGAAGGKEGKPPFRHHSGRDSQCRAGSATHCVFHSGGDSQCRAGSAPLGYLFGRDYKCRRRFNAGVPGAEPPAK